MKQQSIDLRNEFQPATEEIFFDEETVQRIPAVVPLEETPTRASARFRKLRVPMRKADNSFNPAFLIMALVAVTALGVIAGTLLYRTATEKSANAAVETDEPLNRTISPQYQFVVDKPESTATKDSLSKDNLNSLPTSSAPSRKDSGEKEESSAPVAENEQQPPAEKEEEVVEEPKVEVPSEEDEELPPPPPPRRDRKEDKKQNKAKPKNDNAKSETQEEAPPMIDESSEN